MNANADFTPVFALGTVLFPGGLLPLRVFEPRYLDMIGAALKSERPFGVCLIRAGRETGAAAQVHPVGTLARIVDWQRLPDGLLGIVVLGEDRFRAVDFETRPNQLLTARVEHLSADAPTPVPAGLAPMRLLYDTMRREGADVPDARDDAGWLAYRLAERLPLDALQRQELLTIDDPAARLRRLQAMLHPPIA